MIDCSSKAGGHIRHAMQSSLAAGAACPATECWPACKIWFAQPVHAMPVHQDVFDSLGSSALRQIFDVDDGSAVALARVISTQLSFKLWLGGEPDTPYNVNQSLIAPLLHLDSLASDSFQGFLPACDKGDPYNTGLCWCCQRRVSACPLMALYVALMG